MFDFLLRHMERNFGGNLKSDIYEVHYVRYVTFTTATYERAYSTNPSSITNDARTPKKAEKN